MELPKATELERLEPSGWAFYLSEREGKEVLEFKQGLIVCQPLETHFYIADIYVRPELRKTGIASAMADLVAAEAKSRGYTRLLGSVSPQARGATGSLSALLAYGFKVISADSTLIYLEKAI